MKNVKGNSKKSEEKGKEKPNYVVAMEAAFGLPSKEGFGSAVFFTRSTSSADLEHTALHIYQMFVGELWDRWGEEAWMMPWRTVYVRPQGVTPAIIRELKAIEDRAAALSAPLVVDVAESSDTASKALAQAYDAPEVTDVRVNTIGDGEAMSGLLVSGLRDSGEAIFLAVLMD